MFSLPKTDPQRPLGPADLLCPLWKKSCVKVCHTCPLWQPVEFQAVSPTGEVGTERRWNCALAWNTIIGLDTGKRVEGLRAEHEGMKKTLGQFLGGLIRAKTALAGQPPAKEITDGREHGDSRA